MSVEVRQTSDLAAVRRLGIAAGLDDSERGDEGIIAAWGAYDGERLVGSVVLERLGELDTVNWMAVDEGYRRRGIAGDLLAALAAEARRRGTRRLWVTARTPAFFLANGFSEAGPGAERDLLLGDCPACDQYGRGCTPMALTTDLEEAE